MQATIRVSREAADKAERELSESHRELRWLKAAVVHEARLRRVAEAEREAVRQQVR